MRSKIWLAGELIVDPLEEAGEIVGDKIDVGALAALAVGRLAFVACALRRHDQRRRHAARLGRAEVLGEILEHRRASGVDAVAIVEGLVGLRRRLGRKLRSDDVENILEKIGEPKARNRAQRVIARAVGENQSAAGQARQLQRQLRVGAQPRAVDVMGEGEEVRRFGRAFVDEPAQRRAMALIVIMLQLARREPVKAAQAHQVQRDALVDLRPQPAVGGIKRVVEIEHPGRDMTEFGQEVRFEVVLRRVDGHRKTWNSLSPAELTGVRPEWPQVSVDT